MVRVQPKSGLNQFELVGLFGSEEIRFSFRVEILESILIQLGFDLSKPNRTALYLVISDLYLTIRIAECLY